MLLKVPRQEFVPGTPEIPAVPEQTICPPEPPPGYIPPPTGNGHWETQCTTIQMLLGWDYGPASHDNPGPFPKPIYGYALTCRSVWVRDD